MATNTVMLQNVSVVKLSKEGAFVQPWPILYLSTTIKFSASDWLIFNGSLSLVVLSTVTALFRRS